MHLRCPAHGGKDPNCSLWRDERGLPRARCWSRGCAERDILAALGARGTSGDTSDRPHDYAKCAELARRIWQESRPAAATHAEQYLRSRGITLPVPPSLRFHPSLRHRTGVYAPAMVAAVQTDTHIVAVHRTFLAADGGGKANLKPEKMALGPIAGAAVPFAKAAETLALAEGIETALSIQQATGIATWATLGTSNLTRILLPDCVREVIIAADADPAGEKAALQAAARFMREGRKARIARPAAGDFNDLLTEVATS